MLGSPNNWLGKNSALIWLTSIDIFGLIVSLGYFGLEYYVKTKTYFATALAKALINALYLEIYPTLSIL